MSDETVAPKLKAENERLSRDLEIAKRDLQDAKRELEYSKERRESTDKRNEELKSQLTVYDGLLKKMIETAGEAISKGFGEVTENLARYTKH